MTYEVLKNTDNNHPDYAPLEKTLESIKEAQRKKNKQTNKQTKQQINEQNKEFTRREEVKEIERKFTQNVKLLAPARQFVRRGKLWKVCRKQDRVYHFFLFSDLLLYASQYGTKLNLHNQLEINQAFHTKWLSDENDKYGPIKGRAFEV
ncbi:hypothetical protein RFI_17270, partial [Reticulomyxa filosa]